MGIRGGANDYLPATHLQFTCNLPAQAGEKYLTSS